MASKIKMRRYCLLLSYCGKNYHGMQRNPGTKTIEECLLVALRDTSLIQEEHYVRPQLMFYQRAARTDKAVSAIRQVVSLKLSDAISTKLPDVNKLLPEDIRLMGYKRVTQSFDAKNYCDARTYSYLMPSFTLAPMSQADQEQYKLPTDIIKRFNETLQGFVGTHNFHNFTSGKTFNEDSSARVIRYMNCSEPFFPCNQDKLEFVVVRVKGQSFMMHQIRKMIGLAIAIMKGFATEDHLKRSMEQPFMDIPKAPGLGLMLEEVHFDRYNRRFGNDGHHEPIEWNDQNNEIDAFKEAQIYPVVVETEIKDKPMISWMRTLNLHSYGSTRLRRENVEKSSNGEVKESVEPASHSNKTTQPDDEGQPTKKTKLDDESVDIEKVVQSNGPN